MDIYCFANGEKNGVSFRESFRRKIKKAFLYQSDLVNTKTTIPLRVGEERWIYTSTLRVLLYIPHYSPPLRGIVVYYLLLFLMVPRDSDPIISEGFQRRLSLSSLNKRLALFRMAY